ncbi:MAG TPA: hypothetical protein PKH94_02695 [Bacteroidales bacterium]|nr:hypothetical protein [Bacteroidales bacterium]HNS46126.1 hypothetical protein [Bacteroidales bacterium]
MVYSAHKLSEALWSISILAMVGFFMGCSSGEGKKIISTFAGGDPKQVSHFRMEGKDTVWFHTEYLYQNGNKQLEGGLGENDRMQGAWTIWYENGAKNAETNFQNGVRKGDWQVWDFDGNSLPADLYQMEFDSVGFPLMIRYFKMEKDTSRTITGEVHFYPNHFKKTEGPVMNKQKHGLWKAWYSDGTKWSEGNFQHDVNHGKHTVWHENGQKFYEGEYIVGKRTGIWTFWAEDGRIIKELNYSELQNQLDKQSSQ